MEKKTIQQSSGVNCKRYPRVENPKDADACAWVFKTAWDFVPYYFKFPNMAPHEVRAKVLYTGLCHTDVGVARGDMFKPEYPLCPGHEVVGKIQMVGSEVKDLKIGDIVMLGPFRDSCFKCEQCKRGDDNICSCLEFYDHFTYGHYFGGYATHFQQPAHHCFKVPEGMDIRTAPPLVCAGVTVLVPMLRHIKEKGAKVGIIGIGGLGHLAIQYGKVIGCNVTAFTTSEDKMMECKALGASEVVLVDKNLKSLELYKDKMDFLVNTLYVIDMKTYEAYLGTLKNGGVMIQVGVPPLSQPMELNWATLIFKQIAIVGSNCGSIEESKQSLEFSLKHNIKPVIEEYTFEEFPKAFNRIEKERPHFRCVVNVQDFTDRHFPDK
jgi:D-arabinose 1-dehydrogenase-like Zn-dependent alcohol dehydrogenase